MIGGGLTGPGHKLQSGDAGLDKLGTDQQNPFDVDPKDLALYARGDRRDAARDDGKAGSRPDDQVSTQMRKAMDFDAVHGRPSGLGDSLLVDGDDEGTVKLAQADTGTVDDARPKMPNPSRMPKGRVGVLIEGAKLLYDLFAGDDGKTKAPPATLSKPGDRHEDDSCAPEGKDGTWVVVNRGGMSDQAEAYQQQITRTPDLPGKLMIEYEVTDRATGDSVKMDGCAVWSENKELLDAKYASGKSSDIDTRAPDVSKQIMKKEETQAGEQVNLIGRTHPVEWHVSEGPAKPRFEDAVKEGTDSAPNFSVKHTPAATVD